MPSPRQSVQVMDRNRRLTASSAKELPSPYDRRSTEQDVPEDASVSRSATVSTTTSQGTASDKQTPMILPQRSDSLPDQAKEIQFTLYRGSQSSDDEIVLQPASTAASHFSLNIPAKQPRTDLPETPLVDFRPVSSLDASHSGPHLYAPQTSSVGNLPADQV